MPNKLPFEEFKAIYAKVPRLCVEAVVNTDKGVLLTLRDIEPAKGFWHLPGGTVLLDESVEEALHRVVKDEIGVESTILKFLGVIDFYQSEIEIYGHTVSLVYQVRLESSDFKLNSQATKINFFEILPENIIKEHQEFLEKQHLV